MKILGLVGSQRKDGNSYLILKEALEGSEEGVEIVQLAEM
jgi:multimeric flavodoxin WrbA